MKVIAIDGPAGAGKTTISREVAKRLGFIHLNSGMIYRAIAWGMKKETLNIKDVNALREKLEDMSLTFEIKNGELQVFYDGSPIGDELCSLEISRFSSEISQLMPIRDYANRIQRSIALKGSLVVEGRDASTVVFPEACLKIFLYASQEVRALRRWRELLAKGIEIPYEKVLEEVIERDQRDQTREIAPLKRDKNAFLIDCSQMSVDDVVDYIINLFKDHCNSD